MTRGVETRKLPGWRPEKLRVDEGRCHHACGRRIFIGELAESRIAVAVKNSLCGLELPTR
jgi:hypothetical protein